MASLSAATATVIGAVLFERTVRARPGTRSLNRFVEDLTV
jgi:hypothetical protein